MPRQMQRLDQVFAKQVADALSIAQAGEKARLLTASFSVKNLEVLYEAAFLRVFVQWEVFLEEAFLRYLCGHQSRHGVASLAKTKAYATSLSGAKSAVLGSQSYVLWHNPFKVVKRSTEHFVKGRHEIVVSSAYARIEAMAHVRHRIAHGHQDARAKFEKATLMFAGRTFSAARVGRFLRDSDYSVSPPRRWIDILANELSSLANQIV
jgi:hypothetical protein